MAPSEVPLRSTKPQTFVLEAYRTTRFLAPTPDTLLCGEILSRFISEEEADNYRFSLIKYWNWHNWHKASLILIDLVHESGRNPQMPRCGSGLFTCGIGLLFYAKTRIKLGRRRWLRVTCCIDLCRAGSQGTASLVMGPLSDHRERTAAGREDSQVAGLWRCFLSDLGLTQNELGPPNPKSGQGRCCCIGHGCEL